MKDEYGFTAFEEKLFLLASDFTRIRQYRRSSLVTGILFSLLLAGAWIAIHSSGKPLPPHTDPLLASALAVYALMTCLTLWNFRRALSAYRSILVKIEAKKNRKAAPDRPPEPSKEEKMTETAVLILTVLYCAVLILWTAGAVHRNSLPAATILFLLAAAVLKVRFADFVISGKEKCLEAAGTPVQRPPVRAKK